MNKDERKCKYAENKSGDVYECNGYRKVDCPFVRSDYNPDGSVNIFICDYVKIDKVEK